jgi:hypothetical protein
MAGLPARLRFLLLLGAVSAIPETARAAASSSDGAHVAPVVAAVLLIGAAYILADRVVGWLEERFLVMSGVEYILLGAALGSDALGVPLFQNLTPMLPVIALAAGWVGLMRGAQLSYREIREGPRGLSNVVTTHHLFTGLAVGFGTYFALTGWHFLHVGHREAAIAAAALGCCAAADSAEPIEILAKRYRLGGQLTGVLRNATHLGDVLVITAFGLIFCAVHRGAAGVPRLSWFEWFGVTVGVGMVLGWVFRWFLEEDRSGNTSFLALVGIVCFASGAAYFLELSPLLVNLVMGLFLARAPSHGAGIKDALVRTERPMAIVLLILAGALYRPTPLVPTLAGFAGFVALRFATKAIGSRVASVGTDLRKDLHRGLMTHGVVAVAMAVSFRLVYTGLAVDVAYAVMLLSFVFHNLIGPRLVRSLLVDEGEITRESDDAAAPSSARGAPATAGTTEGEVA